MNMEHLQSNIIVLPKLSETPLNILTSYNILIGINITTLLLFEVPFQKKMITV